jgi:hypothetical protein
MLKKNSNERIDAEELFNYLATNLREGDVTKSSIDITGQSINLFNVIDLPRNCGFGRMVLFNNDSKLLIADKKNHSLHILDVFKKEKTTERALISGCSLKEPKALYVDKEDIYVADWAYKQILIFESNFKLKRKIGEEIKRSNYLSVNQHKCENKVLFISHTRDNEISLWDISDGSYLQNVEIEAPRDLKFRDDNLFILSKNGIILMNKNTLLVRNQIEFNDICLPQALHLSQTSAYLIGYSIDKNKVKSDKFHLFMFLNSDFDKKHIKIELTREISFFTDVVYLQNRIILCGNFQNNNQNEEEEEANQVAFIDFN